MPRKRREGLLKLFELVFFPSRCRLCSALLEIPGENIVCGACLEKISPSFSSFCLCCGKFFEAHVEPHLCSGCLKDRPPFALHRSYGRYHGVLKEIILLFKYRDCKVLGKELAKRAFEFFAGEERLWWDVDFLVPVPLHPRRKKQRGFNQAAVLALELSKRRETEVLNGVLVKKRNVPPQTLLSGAEREINVSGAFRVKHAEKVKDKTLLLVDDVFTTGATLTECSRVLKEAGAKEIRAMTIAQAL